MLLICGALSGRRSSAIRSCAGDRQGHAGRWAAWLMVPIGARALSVARTRLPRPSSHQTDISGTQIDLGGFEDRHLPADSAWSLEVARSLGRSPSTWSLPT